MTAGFQHKKQVMPVAFFFVGLLSLLVLFFTWHGVKGVRLSMEQGVDLLASLLVPDVRQGLLEPGVKPPSWQQTVRRHDGLRGVALYQDDGQRIFVYRNPKVNKVQVPEMMASPQVAKFQRGCEKGFAVKGEDGQLLGYLWLSVGSYGHPIRYLPVVLVVMLMAIFALAGVYLLTSLVDKRRDDVLLQLAGLIGDICQSKNFTLRADTQGGKAFHELSAAINQLLDEIVSGQDEMVSLQEHLESRVETRTAALQEINTRLRKEKVRADNAATVKSDFLANMSHEIRTPMNGIIAACDLAIEEEVSPKVGNYLKIIQESSHALLLVVRDILDYSRREAGNLVLEKTFFSLDELENGVVDSFQAKAVQEHLDFQVGSDADVPRSLLGDLGRLRQIIDNLVDNGIKFTKSGSVSVHFACEDIREKDLQFIVTVQDTGIGLAQESVRKIFEAFHQEDSSMTREYGGTGLGLAISKRLASMMGGTITVDGELGRGATFTVAVRLGWQAQKQEKPALSPGKAVDSPAEESLDLAGLHFLLVEDNEINRGIAEAMLTGLGVTVDTAVNGKIGVDKVGLHSYDAVFMDMQMPVLDGYGAIEQIRAMPDKDELPIIALTAHALEYDRKRCLQVGANDYLSKPVKLQEMLTVLARIFGAGAVQAPTEGDAIALVAERVAGSEGASASGEIDRAGAIRRLGVEDSVYDRVVDTFCKDYQGFADRLAQALDDQDLSGVQTLSHSLKGSSGTVGADRLAQLAKDMEFGCKDGKFPTPDQVGELLTDLQEVLKRFSASQPLLAPEPEVSGEFIVEDEQLVAGQLQELAEALDQSMYDAINASYQSLSTSLQAPELAELDQMIRMYQYEEAYALVGQLQEKLTHASSQVTDES